MENRYLVRKKTEAQYVTAHGEDGLEAACKAFPHLDFEVLDVAEGTTILVDQKSNAMYLAILVRPA